MRRADTAATLASVVVLTGVQGIAPALPQIRDQFGLDDAETSLLTLGYLIAAACVAAPIAALADRLGERRVLVTSLVVFGLSGAVVAVTADFAVLVIVRTVQGAAFGVVLALTVGLTGKGLDTALLARAQSVRVMAMALAEVVLPIAAGALLGVASWRLAAALQLAAIPVAVVCAVALPGRPPRTAGASAGEHGLRPAVAALRTPFGAAVQVPGYARFLIKFTLLTYVPLLAADAFGMSPWSIGVVLSVTAVASILAAWLAAAALARHSTARVTLIGLLLAAMPFVVLPAAPAAGYLAVLVVITGLGDGILGVANNVSASMAAPDVGRSAFFGLTGSIRNLGKFSALAVVGGTTLVAPLGGALVLVGVLGVASTAAVPAIARGQSRPPPEPTPERSIE
ncbi:sugar efflux transporter [Mycolicibacterium vanbaalenii]|uniref:Sugar efflux transporter n=1 Tax=Mycolicibacterium vanbaalenii TaxID=110539 RepID=A0A5S9R4F3_MYCVN|nr:MFS transporter [Mycolicibacterium vanbaalenii]CAA0128098.1 sugar efflux transporter [Mycolicibacterium vanbaalenii]